ncbi:hypothetical protein EDC01DRAFT_392238 [Geopyxis carbonaria]|nr:hypothetical protein EDC01DRAFT_392238 [Geopyxis carbonaria]
MILNSTQVATFLSHSYDIVILGGGLAGLTLANRLSHATPPLTIGVLEAGPSVSSNPLVTTPGKFGVTMMTSLDWNYTTVPQENLDGRVLPWAAGKLLGGGSGLNYMVWDVGHSAEYDTWGKIVGDEAEWNGEEILKYVRKVEKIHAPTRPNQDAFTPEPPYNPKFHGTKGEISVGFSFWQPESTKTFLPAFEACGVKSNPDPFGGDNSGAASSLSSTTEQAKRSYAGNAYPLAEKKNLVILTGVNVGRVLISKGTAHSVEFYDASKKKHIVEVKRGGEIIVSTGTIQSPKILELSGIGSKAVLAKAGIRVIVENAHVGENLQDHVYNSISYEYKEGEITRDLLSTNATFAAAAAAEYAATPPSGVLTTTPGVLAFIPATQFISLKELEQYKTPRATLIHAFPSKPASVPQIEILLSPYKISTSFQAAPGKSYLTLLIALMHPLSRGTVHITSSDPFAYPKIDPRLYSEPLDKAMMIAASRFTAKIPEAEPLKARLAGRMNPAPSLGPSESLTDDQWWAQMKREAGSVKHYIGTCAMGTVVDSRLRVKGVKGLRVVDASVFPSHVSAHTQSSVYALAEKAAIIILRDRKGY